MRTCAFGAGLYIDATLGIGPQAYWADILSIVTMTDLYHSFGKSVIFTILIGAISVSIGMGVSGGADVLGKATTSSIVTCIISIIAADAMFALVMHRITDNVMSDTNNRQHTITVKNLQGGYNGQTVIHDCSMTIEPKSGIMGGSLWQIHIATFIG